MCYLPNSNSHTNYVEKYFLTFLRKCQLRLRLQIKWAGPLIVPNIPKFRDLIRMLFTAFSNSPVSLALFQFFYYAKFLAINAWHLWCLCFGIQFDFVLESHFGAIRWKVWQVFYPVKNWNFDEAEMESFKIENWEFQTPGNVGNHPAAELF